MAIPRTVGKYEIVDAVGAGGMGTVYRAFDPTLERMVALKIVHLDRVHDVPFEQLCVRFRNEARAVARLNHPAIVTIFDYDDQDPVGAYIAMEYVQGCALDEYVKQRPELHLEDAVSAMHQVLGGLAYAHARDVVHRDIKPSNLLVTRDGLVKITDFGIARIGPKTTTQTGLLVGTPQYMAPEQWMGGLVDHRCDIHAAGAVLYELLTGTPPFTGTSAEVMYKVCNEVPKLLSAVDSSIPKALDAIVARALEKIPANRYASAQEFQQALRSGWQAFSPKPPSLTLSQSARVIATAHHSQPPGARPAAGEPPQDAARAASVSDDQRARLERRGGRRGSGHFRALSGTTGDPGSDAARRRGAQALPGSDGPDSRAQVRAERNRRGTSLCAPGGKGHSEGARALPRGGFETRALIAFSESCRDRSRPAPRLQRFAAASPQHPARASRSRAGRRARRRDRKPASRGDRGGRAAA